MPLRWNQEETSTNSSVSLYPDAKEIASNLPEITIATRNPDTVGRARDLNGTDVGVIRGKFGVAENGCVWIPQQMKEKAVCFISENLIILLPKSQIVNNMHEAYKRIEFDKTYDGYGTFISGPSKTADIAQVLVMGLRLPAVSPSCFCKSNPFITNQ